ncbi:hypothetical protein Godav_015135, partial [Gossypium davidsonii]|nr:hypothetical protein [Gossypium davidsonii]MBA0650131.1 hypothetical protein [Gossypium klotzschianum]
IGKDAQTTTDVVEEIDVEDVSNIKNPEEGNIYHECEDDVSLDEMDVSATQSQLLKPNQDDSTFSKKKKISDKSEILIQESAQKLYFALGEGEGLAEDEHFLVL